MRVEEVMRWCSERMRCGVGHNCSEFEPELIRRVTSPVSSTSIKPSQSTLRNLWLSINFVRSFTSL